MTESRPTVRRLPGGLFAPGQSGNVLGRPKRVEQITDLALEHAPEAFTRIVALISHNDPKIALAASIHVLDRAFGKPSQAVQAEVAKWDMSKLWLEVVKMGVPAPCGEPKTIDGTALATTTTTTTTPATTLPAAFGGSNDDGVTTLKNEW
jgi:hypothetical protein